MGVLHYAINNERKEIFCLGKYGKYHIVNPMKEGKTDAQIIEEEMRSELSAITREWFASVVAGIRAFSVDEVLHEDYLGTGQGYDDYTYVGSVHKDDSDMFGKTVLQYYQE